MPSRKYVSLNFDGEVKDASSSVCTLYFKNLSDFTRHIDSLKLSGWSRSTQGDNSSVALRMFDGVPHMPKYQLIVDSSLGFSFSVYGLFLPDMHPIYLTHKRSVRFSRVFPLLSDVQELQLCTGLSKLADHEIRDRLFNSNGTSFTSKLCGFLNGVHNRILLTRRGSSPLTKTFTSQQVV